MPPECLRFKGLTIPNVGKIVEKLELSVITLLVRIQQCNFWVYTQHKWVLISTERGTRMFRALLTIASPRLETTKCPPQENKLTVIKVEQSKNEQLHTVTQLNLTCWFREAKHEIEQLYNSISSEAQEPAKWVCDYRCQHSDNFWEAGGRYLSEMGRRNFKVLEMLISWDEWWLHR